MPDFYANIFTKEQLAAFIEGIECCLCSVATDTNVPDRAGITAIFEDGKLILYSTNDQTMARAKLTVEDETLSGRIILNAAFCKRLVASKKKMKAIDVSFDGSFILADLTDATLFGRLLHSDNPPDFRKMILKHLSPVRTYIEIDKDVTEIIERACVIVNKRDDKRVRLNVDNSRLYVLASSWDETAKIDHPDVSVLCNPELIKRGLPRFQRWRITPDCIIMATRLEQTNLRYLISTGK